MKKYLLFGFNSMYKHGGLNDFLGAFKSMKKAYKYFKKEIKSSNHYGVYQLTSIKNINKFKNEKLFTNFIELSYYAMLKFLKEKIK